MRQSRRLSWTCKAHSLLQSSLDKSRLVKGRRKLAGGELYRFDGLDMRSRRARRIKSILADAVREFGEGNPHAVRELAVHRLAIESIQADVVAGKAGASERAVRHSNVIARLERELRAAARTKAPATLSLHEYLRQNYPLEAPTAASGEAASGYPADADAEAAV